MQYARQVTDAGPIFLARERIVPVTCVDGTLLQWEQIVEDLPEASKELASEGASRWTFITQQEHPVLRTPWFAAHPCETAALMRLLLSAPDADVSPAAADISACVEGSSNAVDIRVDAMISARQPGHCPPAIYSGAAGMPPSDASSAVHQQVSACSPLDVPAFCLGPALPAAGIRKDVSDKTVPNSLQSDGCGGHSGQGRILKHTGLQYLASWLSLVAPAVRLLVPVRFWQECKQRV